MLCLFEWGISGWKSQLYNDVLRIAIGFAGSIFVYCLFKLLYSRIKDFRFMRFLTYTGSVSFGIYIISMQVNQIVLPIIGKQLHYSLLLNIIETVVIVLFSIGVIKLIQKSKISNKYLLGAR